MDDGTPLVHASAHDAPLDEDPMLGQVLAGRFTIRSRLGSGSMGTVYRATQAPIGREVALKILRTDRAVDDASRARFLREARANSALTSPNTVTVFDFGQSENGEFYLAMELLEGESVGDRIRRVGRLGVAESLEVAQQALRSLAEAHAKGIIHRDLKPDNLFFARIPAVEEQHPSSGGSHEVVKVLDFGVAKMLRDDSEGAMDAVETQAGTVFGTPRYMSPEQAQGKPLDARTDLYSLGVILYHMLTGNPPFTDDDAIVVMARHIKSTPVPPREAAPDAGIAPEVEAIVMRSLSKEPAMRPASAESMLADLRYAAERLTSRASDVRSSIAPPAIAPAARRAAESTWTGRFAAPWRSKRRWPVFAASGVGAVVVGALAFVLAARSVDSRQTEPPATPASPVRAADPPAAPELPPAAPADPPSPSVASPPLAPPSPLPPAPRAGQASASGISRPPRPARPAASAPPAKPAKRQVGYGYLE